MIVHKVDKYGWNRCMSSSKYRTNLWKYATCKKCLVFKKDK